MKFVWNTRWALRFFKYSVSRIWQKVIILGSIKMGSCSWSSSGSNNNSCSSSTGWAASQHVFLAARSIPSKEVAGLIWRLLMRDHWFAIKWAGLHCTEASLLLESWKKRTISERQRNNYTISISAVPTQWKPCINCKRRKGSFSAWTDKIDSLPPRGFSRLSCRNWPSLLSWTSKNMHWA